MTLVVPFDGTELSKAALVRAAQFRSALDEDVLAVSVIPKNNTEYAVERGWLEAGAEFDGGVIVDHLRESVAEIDPDAAFHHIVVGRYAPRGTIANEVRRFARENDASFVFVGSANAGRMVSGLTVGRSVTADQAYDTVIISAVRPSKSETLEQLKSTDEVLD